MKVMAILYRMDIGIACLGAVLCDKKRQFQMQL